MACFHHRRPGWTPAPRSEPEQVELGRLAGGRDAAAGALPQDFLGQAIAPLATGASWVVVFPILRGTQSREVMRACIRRCFGV